MTINPGWNAVVETNLTGTYLMCREAHRQHMRDHGGSIVNIIADMFRGFPMMAHTGQISQIKSHVSTGAAMFSPIQEPRGLALIISPSLFVLNGQGTG